MSALGLEPAVSLRLRQGDTDSSAVLQLNRQSFSNLNYIEITTFDTSRLSILVSDAMYHGVGGDLDRLDLLHALQSGLLELVAVDKGYVVPFHPPKFARIPGNVLLHSPDSPEGGQKSARIEVDSTSQVWKTCLQPGKIYELRLSEHGGGAWAYYREPWHPASPLEQMPPPCILHLLRDTTSTIRFIVYNDPAPPTLFANLVMPKECHRSGSPPFKFVIEFSTDSKQTITIDKSETPLSSFEYDLHGVHQLLDCEDVETGSKVNWPRTYCCFDGDPRPKFPEDDDFVEVGPGKIWRFEYVIEEDGPGSLGGLETLKVGHTYKAGVAAKYLKGFPRWLVGKKEDLLKGNLAEKQERWNIDRARNGRVKVNVRQASVRFSVVE